MDLGEAYYHLPSVTFSINKKIGELHSIRLSFYYYDTKTLRYSKKVLPAVFVFFLISFAGTTKRG